MFLLAFNGWLPRFKSFARHLHDKKLSRTPTLCNPAEKGDVTHEPNTKFLSRDCIKSRSVFDFREITYILAR